jgi:hypothetical protein
MKTELEIALNKEFTPTELPLGLPLAHLTASRWLASILNVGRLEPRPCKIFSKNLLYFSYGGVFYRTSKLPTEQATELPVALVFSPTVMNLISQLFPFDSGALAADMFGPEWTLKLAPHGKRFCINTTDALTDARRLVYHLFESNPQYLKGIAASSGKHKEDPFPLLYEFLTTDLSSRGVDHRQRAIEAISEIPIELAKHLLWIGFPAWETSSVLKELYRWTAPVLPQFETYEYTKNFNPSEIAARLEDKAYRAVIEKYAVFPV